MSVFSRFPERLQHAIAHELGFTSLRPVQELAGEAILDGKNAVVLAPTAGGKTEASMFPVIAGLMQEPPSGVGALYVAPIKALLNNQEVRLGKYTEMVGLRRFVWHGDAQQSQKAAFVREPAELLMTTPESLEVMLMSPRVPVQRLFKDLRYVVIDEIHAFAGSERGAHLMSVLERLRDLSDHDVQRIGLSATVGNPDYIAQWLAGTSQRASVLVDPAKPKAERRIAIYLREDIQDFGRTAVREGKGKKSLFFCQSRALTETVADQMRDDSIEVFVHHGSVSKEERQAAEERFATGTNACIVATSTLELGIDVGGLDLTFQANAPSTVSSFLQRMGRTGRREGAVANMTFLCEDTVYVVQNTALVLLASRGWVESVKVETRCWPVVVHQLLAMTQQFGGISAERSWLMLERVPDFRGISKDEYLELVEHMKREGYLFEAGGLLSMGQKAEKVFGKKNFLELYAVFSSPQLYKVQTESKRDLGSLEQAFVDRLVDEMSTFLLGGRAWLVVSVNHDERLVRVRPAPRGKKPSWGGYIPQFLGFDLCQEMRAVLTSDADYPFLDAAAKTALTEWRGDLGQLLHATRDPLQFDGDVVTWWTFAGGRINQTLKYALEWRGGWKVIPDNFSIKIQGAGLSPEAVLEVLKPLRDAEFWHDAETRQKLRSLVPEYRLSKFQQVLPDRWQTEMVGGYLLDFDGAAKVLGERRSRPGAVVRQRLDAPEPEQPAEPEPPAHTRSARLKCLSIRPAWAWMIIYLQAPRWKDVENRSWTTRYRGPLLIHASKALTHEEYDDACALALSAGKITRAALPTFAQVAEIRGTLIGAVRLVNVAAPGRSTSPWHHFESHGWQVSERVPFTPRPLGGKLSLFDVELTPVELEALRAAQLID